MNPRGSQGYGQTFVDAIRGGWGSPDYDDLMRGVDVLLEQGYVDRDRLGVLGGSYGGYMTCWIVGHTDRFRAAVASRSVTNLISMYGSSDAGWMLEDWEFCELFGAPDAYQQLWDRSPLAYAAQVTTPLLLTHGANDLRCALGQAEEMYVALRRLGKVAELVTFPGSNHEIARGGAPKMRIARLGAIVDWFGRYLGA
jgi:LSD1 subclass zinc finger protein